MKLIYGVTTCDRPKYFDHSMTTWIDTVDVSHEWHVVICDDSSVSDYSSKYVEILEQLGIKVTRIKTARRGPHYLVNQVLRIASKEEFDYGFMAEDDIYFIQKGWDNNYLKAIKKSSLDYLCYWNSSWAKKHERGRCVHSLTKYPDKLIQSEVRIFSCFGCFWTFSPEIIKTVGYFDMINFGVWGNAHTDYAKRCCRLGHNGINGYIFDVLDSNEFIEMEDDGYVSTGSGREFDSGLVGVPNGNHKGIWLNKNKINFVSYNEIPLNMFGELV